MGWITAMTFGVFVLLGLTLSSRWQGSAKRVAPIVAGTIALVVGMALRAAV